MKLVLTYQFYIEDTDSHYLFDYELSDADVDSMLPKAVYAVMGMSVQHNSDYAERLLKAFPEMKSDFMTDSKLREILLDTASTDTIIVENAENAFLDEYYKQGHGTLTRVSVSHRGQYVPAYMEYGVDIDMEQVK